MALPVLGSIVLGSLMFYYIDKIIDQAGGDPEGKLATEIGIQEHLAQSAQMAPVHRMQFEERVAPRYQQPVGELAGDVTAVRSGMMDVEIMGSESKELLGLVAGRMGMSTKQLADRVNPMRQGDYSDLTKVAFGRRASEGIGK